MPCKCNLRKRITEKRILIDNKRDIYLDYNATTKPDISVLAEIEKFNRIHWGNPSSQNSRGTIVFNTLIKKIASLKQTAGLDNYNIFFDTSSTSIIERIMSSISPTQIITTEIEHKSLLDCSEERVMVDRSGRINLDELNAKLSNLTKPNIFTYSPINHEVGVIQPYKDIYRICKDLGIKVIFDAVQLISKIHINEWTDYCDGFYYSGHKIHGLQGAAMLAIKSNIIDFKTSESPVPFSLYSGTFNTFSVVALLKATENLLEESIFNIKQLKTLHREALNIIDKDERIIIESPTDGAPGIINISIPVITDIEELLFELNSNGIHISRFSACTGDIASESYILKAMGRDRSRTKTSIRISFGKYSKRDDFFRLTSYLNKFLTSYNR